MNDMELNMVTGGEATAHGSGASGSWNKSHNGPVSVNAETMGEAWEGVCEIYQFLRYIYNH